MFLKSTTIFCWSLLLFLVISANNLIFTQSKIQIGHWNASLELGENIILPFNLEVSKAQKKLIFSIHNAEEKIVLLTPEFDKDSVKIDFPNFHSSLKFKVNNKKHLAGYWINFNKGNDYKIPFEAKYTTVNLPTGPKHTDFSGRWKTTFDPNSSDESMAIGIFKSSFDHITGTFLTETGDYRFLEGNISENTFFLSCFDGSHAFLFTGKLKDEKIEGNFYSGKHFKGNWIATKDSLFELRNPDSLTFIVKQEPFTFKVKNLLGEDFTFPNPTFNNKVTIVQIMGTWCPNCMDETTFFKELYDKYHAQGLEIIAVGYETPHDFEAQAQKIKLLQQRQNLPFTFLVGGRANKSLASEQFSMLNQIMSFPTAIVIGKNGHVERVHTGFNGPGTGKLYEDYTKEMENFIQELLK